MTTLDLNTHYTIVGTGLTGLSCVDFFQQQGIHDFRLVDSRTTPPAAEKIQKSYADIETVYGDLENLHYEQGDILVVSPGIALNENFIEKALAQGAVVSSDIEIFLQLNNKPVIAITGSNGKSTVTTLVGEILTAAGLKTAIAGNIGLPVLSQISTDNDFDIFVLELSSFQLERLQKLNATAVTILNITEDHLDRYASFGDYIKAKQIIFSAAAHIAVNADDALSAVPDELKGLAKIMPFGVSNTDTNGLVLKVVNGQQWIYYGDEALLATAAMKLKGSHNINNVMAAMTLCYQSGVAFSAMLDAVKNFSGLAHRCEWVGHIGDVNFINDSKATNVGAVVAAINGFSQEDGTRILIAGGVDKASDFLPLAQSIELHVDKVVLFGQDADKIAAVLPTDKTIYVDDLDSAVNKAFMLASGRGIVLFSPACASFDMFKNFEHRGDVFTSAVKQLQQKCGGNND